MTSADPFQDAWQAQQRGDFRGAEEGYRKILQKDPRDGRVWLALGSLCGEQGRFTEAVACFQQAIEIAPNDFQGHLRLANTQLQMGKHAEAEATYRRSLALQPANVEAMVNLGYVLGEQEKYEEAIAIYEQARKIAPAVPEVHHNLANMLREINRVEEALGHYDEAIRLRSDYAKAHINKGVALARCCRVEEAVEALKRGVELQPDFAEAHNSLGTALSSQGQLNEAAAAYAQAIALKPDYSEAYWNLSLIKLIRGDYERGWPEYEWRWRCMKRFTLPTFSQPRWDGASLEGRTILLHAEQGLGDTLHFVRYAPLVKELGARVILQCQGGLIPLLTRTRGIDGYVAWGAAPPRFDVWSPLMSLPAVFRTTLENVPARIPYLVPDPVLVEHWKRQLNALPGLRVGIAWKGSPRHAWDRHRSAPLSAFEPLARIPGVHLVSLQKNSAEESGDEKNCPFPVISLGDLIDRSGAFTDTAAIVQNLDLVIAVDTAIAHLSGGLGVPTWLAIHRTPDWRWLLDRNDSPWYPTIHLFRQTAVGEWGPVFQNIARELLALVALKRESRPLLVEVSAGELLDKLTILRIKSERIGDPEKIRNVRREIGSLSQVRAAIAASPELAELERKLKEANERLWDIEDEIRMQEQKQDFGSRFIELARAVYHTNDHRSRLKREINELLKSRLVEEKSYVG
jgi:tetratricopeptide (TPR) repeat protein